MDCTVVLSVNNVHGHETFFLHKKNLIGFQKRWLKILWDAKTSASLKIILQNQELKIKVEGQSKNQNLKSKLEFKNKVLKIERSKTFFKMKILISKFKIKAIY